MSTSLCISLKAATQLGLTPLRIEIGLGSGGETKNQIFFANFQLTVPQKRGGELTMGWEQEVRGIPELDRHAAGIQMAGKVIEVVGLLGRDILRHVKMDYDGISGIVNVQFDLRTLQEATTT